MPILAGWWLKSFDISLLLWLSSTKPLFNERSAEFVILHIFSWSWKWWYKRREFWITTKWLKGIWEKEIWKWQTFEIFIVVAKKRSMRRGGWQKWEMNLGASPRLSSPNHGNCAIEYCKYSIAILFLEKSGI